jgi:5-methylcytosine-specific restriction endonuclease McrA
MHRQPNCTCKICGKPIYRRPSELARGPVYCSQKCFGVSCQKPKACLTCGKEYIDYRSDQKFCSRACANVGRTGIKYRQTASPRRDKAAEGRAVKKRLFDERGARCERCGYSDANILVIHHIVRKSDGGSDEAHNLEIVCPNCHAEIHYYGVKHFLRGQRNS